MRFLPVIVLAGSWLCSLPARAEVAAGYSANTSAPDPASIAGGSWTLNNPGAVNGSTVISAAVAPDGTTRRNAWRMLDNATGANQFAFWSKSLTATQQAKAAANGWRLAGNLRIADPVGGNAGTATDTLLFGDNAGKRWIIFFDIDASGNLTANLVGSSTITVAPAASATAYHLHEMVYDPATATVQYLVDGVSKATGYAGTTGTFNGVQWGNGTAAGQGDSYWNSVSLAIGSDPASQSVAPGASVKFTGGAADATTFQWYKNAAPIAGATAATLNLNSVSGADTADYWLRTTGPSGTNETPTAALVVLTPGAELQISEFVAENDNGLRDEDGERNDWIEIFNPATTAASTAGWKLTDNAANATKWALPTLNIPAGGRVVIFASSKNRAVAGSELHTNFNLGNAAGGYLALVRPDNSAASVFSAYPEQYADLGYGLTGTGAVKYFRIPTPGTPNVDGITAVRPEPVFTPPAGTFSGTLGVTVASGIVGGTLRYTTNGQIPTFDSAAYSAALSLSATTQVRAAVIFPGERYGVSASATYLRLGADVTSFSSPLPIVVLHNLGAGAVPGVASNGPYGDGSDVVQVAKQVHALTILDAPTGNSTFTSPVVTSTRAGVRLRGSSSFGFPRKSYALETWGERYEEARDEALLGMPADNDWVLYAPNPTQFDDALIHNSLIYELARQSGYNAPRTRFVEVFLNTSGGNITMANSLGLYLLIEKPKRGNDRVDFDVMNAAGTAGGWMINSDRMDSLPAGSTIGSMAPRHFHTAGPDTVLPTEDDNLRGYQGPSGGSGVPPGRDDLPNFYHSFFNFESPGGWDINAAQRTVIQTKMRAFDTALYGASYTNPVTGYAPHIDSANWAQHLALHCFAKNQDAVVLSTFIYRETPTARMKFGPIWDFDRAFASNGSATANTTWAHDRLYYPRLMSDPEFAQAYIDQWQNMRRGAFATANMHAVVDAQAAEITSTVAARSGTSAFQWASDIAALKSWLTSRGTALDALYIQPAVFSQHGGSVPAGYPLTITAPAGQIYYTTNGTDPRAVGGGTAGTLYTGAIPITATTTVFARVKSGGAWSGTTIATFYPPQDLQTLRVTELYYNPPGAGAVDGDEFEFFELQNTGLVALDLGGLSFSGVVFTFPNGTTLAPGAYFLLARNQAQLATRFPGAVAQGIYTGQLNNNGETLALMQGTTTVWAFTYDDGGEWPTQPDNGGMSLQRPDPAALGYDVATWAAAAPTPGTGLSLADSDSDGLPDYYEIQHAITDANGDADSDGATNLAEFYAGTRPRDHLSVFKVTATPAGADLQLDFTAVAARTYTVQYRDNLLTGSWQKLIDIPAGSTTHPETLIVTVAGTNRYFRVITPATP